MPLYHLAGNIGTTALLHPNGNVRSQLKTPYRNGATHVIFEPVDFIPRLAAPMPKPHANLTRFYGVFAPHSKHRSQVTPARLGKGNTPKVHHKQQQKTTTEHHAAITWAQRLKRVFHTDIETCSKCGGTFKVIACIQDPAAIEKIFSHLRSKTPPEYRPLSKCRALPQHALFY